MVQEVPQGRQKRLAGDTAREATSHEVKTLRAEARELREALAEATIENPLLKESVIADGGISGEISSPQSQGGSSVHDALTRISLPSKRQG